MQGFEQSGLVVDTMITDRHPQIQKHCSDVKETAYLTSLQKMVASWMRRNQTMKNKVIKPTFYESDADDDY